MAELKRLPDGTHVRVVDRAEFSFWVEDNMTLVLNGVDEDRCRYKSLDGSKYSTTSWTNIMWRLEARHIIVLDAAPRVKDSDWADKQMAFFTRQRPDPCLDRLPKGWVGWAQLTAPIDAYYRSDTTSETGKQRMPRGVVMDAYVSKSGIIEIDIVQARPDIRHVIDQYLERSKCVVRHRPKPGYRWIGLMNVMPSDVILFELEAKDGIVIQRFVVSGHTETHR